MAEAASHSWEPNHVLWRKEVLTVSEAAQLLYVSRPTVYRMIRDGILVPAQIGLGTGKGVKIIPRIELEHYIESVRTVASRNVLFEAGATSA